MWLLLPQLPLLPRHAFLDSTWLIVITLLVQRIVSQVTPFRFCTFSVTSPSPLPPSPTFFFFFKEKYIIWFACRLRPSPLSVMVLNFTLCTLKQLNHCPINLEALAARGGLKEVESVALPVGPTTSGPEAGGEVRMRPQALRCSLWGEVPSYQGQGQQLFVPLRRHVPIVL